MHHYVVALFAALFLIFGSGTRAGAAHSGFTYWVPFVDARNGPSGRVSGVSAIALHDETRVEIDYDNDGTHDRVVDLESGAAIWDPAVAEGTAIHSSNELAPVYHYNFGDNGAYEDGSLAYEIPPEGSLGSDHRVPLAANHLRVLSISDDNDVFLDSDNDGAPDDSVVLNRGGVWSLSVDAGARIVGVKPLLVIAGNHSSDGYDETRAYWVPPTSAAALRLYVPPDHPYSLQSPIPLSAVHVVALEDDTQVSFRGSAESLDAGQVIAIPTDSDGELMASRPVVAVYQSHTSAVDPWRGTRRDYEYTIPLLGETLSQNDFIVSASGSTPHGGPVSQLAIHSWAAANEIVFDCGVDGQNENVITLDAGETRLLRDRDAELGCWTSQTMSIRSVFPIQVIRSGRGWWNGISEGASGHVVLPQSPAQLVERTAEESLSTETVVVEHGSLIGTTVAGDLVAAVTHPTFDRLTVLTGSFAQKGFSRGTVELELEGVRYDATWAGMTYQAVSGEDIVIKGTIEGEVSAAVDGRLSESTRGTGIYDRYEATWNIRRIRSTAVSATVEVSGPLMLGSSEEFIAPLRMSQRVFGGLVSAGDYRRTPVSVVLTNVAMAHNAPIYEGQGFGLVSYHTERGAGDAFIHSEQSALNRTVFRGLFDDPLFGVAMGVIYESRTPALMSLAVHRIDLGLTPLPDLRLDVQGPDWVSPGQTFNYLLAYSNSGVLNAQETVIVQKLPWETEFISATHDGVYDTLKHEVVWKVGQIAPQSNGQVTVRVRAVWGLSGGVTLQAYAYVGTTEKERDAAAPPADVVDALAFDPAPSSTRAVPLTANEWAQLVVRPDVSPLLLTAATRGYAAVQPAVEVVNHPDAFRAAVILLRSEMDDDILLLIAAEDTASVQSAVLARLSDDDTLNVVDPAVLAGDNDTAARLARGDGSYVKCVNNCFFQKAAGILTGTGALLGLKECLETKDYETCITTVAESLPQRKVQELLAAVAFCSVECIGGNDKYSCVDGETRTRCSSWFFPSFPFFHDAVLHETCDAGGWEGLSRVPGPCPNDNSYLFHRCQCEPGEVCRQLSIDAAECVPRDCEAADSAGSNAAALRVIHPVNGNGVELCDPNSSSGETSIRVAHDPNAKYGLNGPIAAGDMLAYRVEYENEGAGTAFGVYVTDTLDTSLDESTLTVGPMLSTTEGSVVSPPGIYDALTRTITWSIGEVGAGQGGYADIKVHASDDAPAGTVIVNSATVYFPSVPETTATNAIVSVVTLCSCGDGLAHDHCGELCDDGNSESGDGCSAVCHIELARLSAVQRKCGTLLDTIGAKTARLRAQQIAKCVKKVLKAKANSLEECLNQDPGGKASRLRSKAIKAASRACTAQKAPAFGVTDARTQNDVMAATELAIVRDVFGDDLDGAVIAANNDDGRRMKCQAAMMARIAKCRTARLTAFNDCKQHGLKQGTIQERLGIEACLNVDPREQIAGQCHAKAAKQLGSACAHVDLEQAIPGRCRHAADAEDLAACLSQRTQCRVCLGINAVDDLLADCDVLDNGARDWSCP